MRFAILLLLVPVPLAGQALRFVADGLIVTDCAATAHAVTMPNHVENNPFLGLHPTPARVVTVCAVGLTLNDVGVRWLVGKRDGQYLWALVALAEVFAVHHQLHQIGWRIPL